MESLAKKYPKYYKALPPGVKPDEVDVYVINMMFPLDDPSGTLEHARKKLLVPGVRSGGKSMLKDIIEARDTLNRYIALHSGLEEETDLDKVNQEILEVSPEGWIAHEGHEMPLGLNPNQLVQVRLDNGHIPAINHKAGHWIWDRKDDVNSIAAWRIPL